MKAGTKREPYVPKSERKNPATHADIAAAIVKAACERYPAEMGAILGTIDGMNYRNKK